MNKYSKKVQFLIIQMILFLTLPALINLGIEHLRIGKTMLIKNNKMAEK
jgi:hypothetical protein